jgi:hypothetical protein
VLFFAIELPLWIFPGNPPQITDAAASAAYLGSIKTIALTRILLDIGMYASLMVFSAGFRHLIIKTRPEYEWAGTLAFVAGAVWWAVSLVADGLEGGAVLDAASGRIDAHAVLNSATMMGHISPTTSGPSMVSPRTDSSHTRRSLAGASLDLLVRRAMGGDLHDVRLVLSEPGIDAHDVRL